MPGDEFSRTRDRRDVGQVVFLGERMAAARELSSCCVGVEAALENNADAGGILARLLDPKASKKT